MQVTVTKDAFKNSTKLKVKSVVTTIFIFIFAFISVIFLVSMKKKSLMFDEQYFYFVSAESSKKISVLDGKKEYLKNIGGAAVTHFYKENYYLVANVYLKLEEAEEIKGNISKSFNQAEVVTVKSSKIEKGVKNKIKQDLNLSKFFEFLYGYKTELYLSSIDFYSGKTNESDFISSFVKSKVLSLLSII